MTLLFNIAGYLYIYKASVKMNSALLKTDALEWKIDSFYNLSLLAAFTLSYLLEHSGHIEASAYVDPVICIVLSVYMCISPAKLFLENVQTLSVSSVDKETQQKIIEGFKV